jgi:hypothetical protein
MGHTHACLPTEITFLSEQVGKQHLQQQVTWRREGLLSVLVAWVMPMSLQ